MPSTSATTPRAVDPRASRAARSLVRGARGDATCHGRPSTVDAAPAGAPSARSGVPSCAQRWRGRRSGAEAAREPSARRRRQSTRLTSAASRRHFEEASTTSSARRAPATSCPSSPSRELTRRRLHVHVAAADARRSSQRSPARRRSRPRRSRAGAAVASRTSSDRPRSRPQRRGARGDPAAGRRAGSCGNVERSRLVADARARERRRAPVRQGALRMLAGLQVRSADSAAGGTSSGTDGAVSRCGFRSQRVQHRLV